MNVAAAIGQMAEDTSSLEQVSLLIFWMSRLRWPTNTFEVGRRRDL